MDALIEVSSSEVETKIIKFANTLRNMISVNTEAEVLEGSACALGHLARASVVSNSDFVDFEVRCALR